MKKPIKLPLKKLNAKIKNAISKHSKWLASSGRKGKKLILRDCVGFDFRNQILDYADFEGANLIFSDFSGAQMRHVNLVHADLSLGTFTAANLSFANLEKSVINGTEFTNVDLTNANLDYIWAEGTNFKGSNLKGASFRGATLDSSKRKDSLSLYKRKLNYHGLTFLNYPLNTKINQKQLNNACGDKETALPRKLKIKKCVKISLIR